MLMPWITAAPTDDDQEDASENEVLTAILYILAGVSGAIAILAGILAFLMVYRSFLKPLLYHKIVAIKRSVHNSIIRWRFSRTIDLEKYVDTVYYSDLQKKGLDAYKYHHVILGRDNVDNMDAQLAHCTYGGPFGKISVKELQKCDPSDIKDAEESCCICLESLKLENHKNSETKEGIEVKTRTDIKKKHIEDTDIVMIPCRHFFHAGCLREWFSPKKRGITRPLVCPLCRMDLVKCKALCIKLGLLMDSVTVEPSSTGHTERSRCNL